MPSRTNSQALLAGFISNPALINHCQMVATAMEFYARKLNKPAAEVEEWWTAGLLHDLDWEQFPTDHPNKAIADILPANGYSQAILDAIAAHAPERTGKQPEAEIEKYLFACDEISGFINAASLVRPTKLVGMEVKSVTKRLKDKAFAANVSREDIAKGVELIGIPLAEHIANLLKAFTPA